MKKPYLMIDGKKYTILIESIDNKPQEPDGHYNITAKIRIIKELRLDK